MKPHETGVGFGAETGAALLSVLILVGIMGAIAVAVFDRLRLATTLARNAAGQEQARAYALAGETLIMAKIDDLFGSGARGGDWQNRAMLLPLPTGTAQVTLADGGNCFNLNSLVAGMAPEALETRPAATAQFTALLRLLGIPDAEARRVVGATADWIDSDSLVGPDGAEDETYARAPQPYRTGNTLLAEASEWRAIAGVAPYYARLRPWVCALPIAELSPINVNTLTPAQAPLLAMLLPQTAGVATAQRALAERPRAGWPNLGEFWNTPALRSTQPGAEALTQPRVRTDWVAMTMAVETAGAELTQSALVDARQSPSRAVSRRWTPDE